MRKTKPAREMSETVWEEETSFFCPLLPCHLQQFRWAKERNSPINTLLFSMHPTLPKVPKQFSILSEPSLIAASPV
jgi:hypothetical protein